MEKVPENHCFPLESREVNKIERVFVARFCVFGADLTVLQGVCFYIPYQWCTLLEALTAELHRGFCL